MEMIERTFEAKVDNLHEVLGFLEEQLETFGANMKFVTVMSISLEEMYANVCMYAYVGQEQPGDCTIGIWLDEENFVNVRIVDSGTPFNPLAKDDPDIHATVEERGIGGLGIYMVKEYMNECLYEYTDNKNIFTMRKELK